MKNSHGEGIGARSIGRSPAQVFRSNSGVIAVMLGAVGLQVIGAVLLKTIANHWAEWAIWLLAVGVAAVTILNFMRLAVWGFAHQRFPLSTTFPLSSLFYPAMLIVAVAFGDVVGLRQILGVLLITSGSIWLSTRVTA